MSGIIQSSGYPHTAYSNNMDCNYTVEEKPGIPYSTQVGGSRHRIILRSHQTHSMLLIQQLHTVGEVGQIVAYLIVARIVPSNTC